MAQVIKSVEYNKHGNDYRITLEDDISKDIVSLVYSKTPQETEKAFMKRLKGLLTEKTMRKVEESAELTALRLKLESELDVQAEAK